jgi:hypothetical protein
MKTDEIATRLLQRLSLAQEERGLRPDFTADGEPGWVAYERQVMVEATNEERERAGLPPVPPEQVRAVERQAEGHSDYSRKFALGCAFLVVGEAHREAGHGQ